MALSESLQRKKKAPDFSFFLHVHFCNELLGRSSKRRSAEAREPDEAELTHFAKIVLSMLLLRLFSHQSVKLHMLKKTKYKKQNGCFKQCTAAQCHPSSNLCNLGMLQLQFFIQCRSHHVTSNLLLSQRPQTSAPSTSLTSTPPASALSCTLQASKRACSQWSHDSQQCRAGGNWS